MADTKISALTAKTLPLAADITNVLDSAAANADKRITLGSIANIIPLYASLADQGYIARKVRTGIAGENIAIFQPCYLKAADSKYWLARANAAGTMSATELVIATAAITAAASGTFMEEGYFRDDSLAAGFTAAVPYYVSRTTAGLLTITIPSTVGDQVMVLGQVTETAKILHFAPTGVIVEVTTALPTFPTGTIVGTTDTQTLTNKRISHRLATIASGATPTPNSDTTDFYYITAQAEAAAFAAPTGTPVEAQRLLIRIEDNGTARALSWNAIYRAGSDLALPTTTVLGKVMYCNFIYNFTDTKWDFIGSIGNF